MSYYSHYQMANRQMDSPTELPRIEEDTENLYPQIPGENTNESSPVEHKMQHFCSHDCMCENKLDDPDYLFVSKILDHKWNGQSFEYYASIFALENAWLKDIEYCKGAIINYWERQDAIEARKTVRKGRRFKERLKRKIIQQSNVNNKNKNRNVKYCNVKHCKKCHHFDITSSNDEY